MEKEEWHRLRRECVTGTDISAIVGLNPYRSALDVYCDKLGLTPAFEGNRSTRWGQILEPVVARHFAEAHGVDIKVGEFIRKGIAGGTPDYYAYFPSGIRLIEIKTADIRSAHRWTDDEFPDEYMCQVQWYLGITGINKAHLAVLIGASDYREYDVDFAPAFFEKLKVRAEKFWEEHIGPQIAPEPVAGDSDTASLMFPKADIESFLPPTMELENLAAELAGLKAGAKETESQIDALEARIKLIMGEKSQCKGNLFSLSWKNNKDSEKTDWKEIASELAEKCPALYADLLVKHTTIKPGPRVFRLNWKGSK